MSIFQQPPMALHFFVSVAEVGRLLLSVGIRSAYQRSLTWLARSWHNPSRCIVSYVQRHRRSEVDAAACLPVSCSPIVFWFKRPLRRTTNRIVKTVPDGLSIAELRHGSWISISDPGSKALSPDPQD